MRIRDRSIPSFLVDLSLPLSAVTVRELVSLQEGQVLMLPQRAREPVYVNVADKPMYLAQPVRHGTKRGARIEKRIPLLPSGVKM